MDLFKSFGSNKNQFSNSSEKKSNLPLIILGIILVLLVAGLLYVFLTPQAPLKKTDAQIINELLPKQDCNVQDDYFWFKNAMDTKDIFVCNCIIENSLLSNCKQSVVDSLYFTRALRTYDVSICDEIVGESTADSCRTVTLGIIEYAKLSSNKSQQAYEEFKSMDFNSAATILEEKLTTVEGKDAVGDLLLLALTYSGKYLHGNNPVDLQNAFDAVAKAEAIVPNEPEIFRVKGYIYEVQPDLDKSIENYTKAIQLNSAYLQSYIGRGHAYNKKGELYSARDDFEKAKQLDVNKEYPEAYVQLCRLYATNSDFTKEAIENCTFAFNNFQGILSSDNLSGIQLTLGDLYFRAGRVEEALDRFKIALTYFPKSTDTLSWIAYVYNTRSDFLNAKFYAEKAISFDPIKAVAHKELGIALLNLGEFDKAIEVSLNGVKYVDEDASLLFPSKTATKKILYYILADAYAAKKEMDKSEQYAKLGEELK